MLFRARHRFVDADRHRFLGLSETIGSRHHLANDALQVLDEGIEPISHLANFVARLHHQTSGQVGFAAGDLSQGFGHAAERPEDETTQTRREDGHQDRIEHDHLDDDLGQKTVQSRVTACGRQREFGVAHRLHRAAVVVLHRQLLALAGELDAVAGRRDLPVGVAHAA